MHVTVALPKDVKRVSELVLENGTGKNSAMGLYVADVPQNQGGIRRCCSWDESGFFSP